MTKRQLKTSGLLVCQAVSVLAATQPSVSAFKSLISSAPSVAMSSVISDNSYLYGPSLQHTVSCWKQIYFPKVIGTVVVTVDQVHNTTKTSTIFNTEVLQSTGSKSGALEIFTRTDIDSDGTVTAVASGQTMVHTDNDGSRVTSITGGTTLTYPTNYNQLNATMTWDLMQAIAPGTRSDPDSCCVRTQSFRPTPFPTVAAPVAASTDSADPSGWNYGLAACPGSPENILTYNAAQVSSIFGNVTLTIPYDGCPYTKCSSQPGSAKGIGFASSQVNILATSTTTLSSVDTTTTPHSSTQVTAQPELFSSSPTAAKTSSSSSSSSTTTAHSSSTTSPTSVSTSSKTLAQLPSSSSSTSVSIPANPSSKTLDQSSSTSSAQTPVPISSQNSATSNPVSTLVAASSPSHAVTSSVISQTEPILAQSPASTLLPPPTTIAFSANSPIPAAQSSVIDNHDTRSSPAAQSSVIDNHNTQSNPAAQSSVKNQNNQQTSAPSAGSQTTTAQTPVSSALPAITLGSTIVQANSESRYVIDGQTLQPGSSISISCTVVSYPSTTVTPTSLPPISIGSTIITPVSSKYLIGSQTLIAGSAVIVSGTIISLAPGATQLVVGTSTSALVSTSSTGPGGYIYSAIANQPSASATVSSGRSGSGTASAPAAHYSGNAQQLQFQNSFLALPIFVAALVFDIL